MRFENSYEFLHPDFVCPVSFAGMRFRSAYVAYQMLRVGNRMARKVFENCDHAAADDMLARYGASDDSDDARLDAMARAQARKFADPELRRRLEAVEGEIVWENDADTFFGVVGGVGENMLGHILEEIRDGNIEDAPDDDLKASPVMAHIHPGFVRALPQDPTRSLVRVPWAISACTVSALLPTRELQPAEAIVRRGAHLGEHYLTAYLESDSYALVCHGKDKSPIAGLVPERLDALELAQTWKRNMREAALRRKAKAERDKDRRHTTVRVTRDTRDDVFAGTDFWSDDGSISFEIATYPNRPLMLRLTIKNLVTGAAKTISCPPVVDYAIPHIPETIAIDTTLFAREVEALCAEGLLLPLMAEALPDPNIYDRHGRYAFTIYWFNYDMIAPASPTGLALSAYAREVNAHDDTIVFAADPDFRAHRAQGRPETDQGVEALLRRQLAIGKAYTDGDRAGAHAMVMARAD